MIQLLCVARGRSASWLVLSAWRLRPQTSTADATDSAETTRLDRCWCWSNSWSDSCCVWLINWLINLFIYLLIYLIIEWGTLDSLLSTCGLRICQLGGRCDPQLVTAQQWMNEVLIDLLTNWSYCVGDWVMHSELFCVKPTCLLVLMSGIKLKVINSTVWALPQPEHIIWTWKQFLMMSSWVIPILWHDMSIMSLLIAYAVRVLESVAHTNAQLDPRYS